MHITQRNSSNTNLQTTNINCATEADVGGVVSTTHDGLRVWEKVFETPAGTDRILFYPMWAWTGFDNPPDGQGLDGSLFECSITPLDETERRTSTQTDNADETAMGQAASIADQGGLATSNYYSQAGDPGSVPNGSFWHDSDDDILYMRVSGVWEKIADVTPVGGAAPLSGIVDPAYAYGAAFGSGTATTGLVTATPSGGTGPYTYVWSMDPSYGIGFTQLIGSANQGFTKSVTSGDDINAIAYCNITDAVGTTIQVSCNVRLVGL